MRVPRGAAERFSHETTAGWQVPLLVVGAVLIVSIPAGIVAGRRRTIEDEWELRHGRW